MVRTVPEVLAVSAEPLLAGLADTGGPVGVRGSTGTVATMPRFFVRVLFAAGSIFGLMAFSGWTAQQVLSDPTLAADAVAVMSDPAITGSLAGRLPGVVRQQAAVMGVALSDEDVARITTLVVADPRVTDAATRSVQSAQVSLLSGTPVEVSIDSATLSAAIGDAAGVPVTVPALTMRVPAPPLLSNLAGSWAQRAQIAAALMLAAVALSRHRGRTLSRVGVWFASLPLVLIVIRAALTRFAPADRSLFPHVVDSVSSLAWDRVRGGYIAVFVVGIGLWGVGRIIRTRWFADMLDRPAAAVARSRTGAAGL